MVDRPAVEVKLRLQISSAYCGRLPIHHSTDIEA